MKIQVLYMEIDILCVERYVLLVEIHYPINESHVIFIESDLGDRCQLKVMDVEVLEGYTGISGISAAVLCATAILY